MSYNHSSWSHHIYKLALIKSVPISITLFSKSSVSIYAFYRMDTLLLHSIQAWRGGDRPSMESFGQLWSGAVSVSTVGEGCLIISDINTLFSLKNMHNKLWEKAVVKDEWCRKVCGVDVRDPLGKFWLQSKSNGPSIICLHFLRNRSTVLPKEYKSGMTVVPKTVNSIIISGDISQHLAPFSIQAVHNATFHKTQRGRLVIPWTLSPKRFDERFWF